MLIVLIMVSRILVISVLFCSRVDFVVLLYIFFVG